MSTETIIFIVLTCLMLGGLVVLWLKLNEQRHLTDLKLDELWRKIEAIQHDVSALCSGARGVDERLDSNEKRVKSLLERVEDIEDNDESGHIQEFQEATKLAQEGALAEEIVEKCNLTIDEASLLVRLHQTSI
jgi:hypothetical protein